MEGGMSARKIGLLAAFVTMGAAGWYVAVYLARWEWNRALVAGVIFLAAEVGVVGVVLVERMGRLERRVDQLADAPHDERPAVHVRAAAPPKSEAFDWLRPDNVANGGMSVFVPVLLGAGVLLSGVAWAVERIARMTAGPVAEGRLIRRLDTLALPPGGFLDEPGPDPFAPGSGGP
jgi:hypothetical protein